MASMVLPAYPRSLNSRPAAAMTDWRVACRIASCFGEW
jgi:hypothetical protein